MTTAFFRCLPACVLALTLPCAVQAADSKDPSAQEIATARAHAGMALGATDLATAQTHLHHVINCLVGPDGASFDPRAENPCKGFGRGAIVDAGKQVDTEKMLHAALSEAQQGLGADSLADAHRDAQDVMNTLQVK